MNNFKKITGISFIIYGTLGVLICTSYMFNWDWFDREYVFGKAYDGDSAANSPSFFGLIAIAGSLLLSQVKDEITDNPKNN